MGNEPDDKPPPCPHVTTEESPIDCILCGERLAEVSQCGRGAIGIHLPAVEWLAGRRKVRGN